MSEDAAATPSEGVRSFHIAVNVADIENRVTEQIRQTLYYDAKRLVEVEVKRVITQELRAQIELQVRTIVANMMFGETLDTTFESYIRSKVEGRRVPEESWRPTRIQEMVDRLVYTHAESWFHEFVRPHLDKIKEDIRSQLLDKILRESNEKG